MPDVSPGGQQAQQATQGCHRIDSDPLWAELMRRAQQGDQAAYQTLLHAVAPYLRTIIRRHLGPGDEVEDALQDVLMIVHGIRHTYEPGRAFKPWISTIATRRCIDLLRRRTHRLRHEIEAGEHAERSAHAGIGPEEIAARRQAAGRLRKAIAGLPERQREAIRLLRLDELSLKEAAMQSDQSVGSLKVACHRAIKSLHGRLAGKENPSD